MAYVLIKRTGTAESRLSFSIFGNLMYNVKNINNIILKGQGPRFLLVFAVVCGLCP